MFSWFPEFTAKKITSSQSVWRFPGLFLRRILIHDLFRKSDLTTSVFNKLRNLAGALRTNILQIDRRALSSEQREKKDQYSFPRTPREKRAILKVHCFNFLRHNQEPETLVEPHYAKFKHAVRVQALPEEVVLRSLKRHFALTVPHFSQVYFCNSTLTPISVYHFILLSEWRDAS